MSTADFSGNSLSAEIFLAEAARLLPKKNGKTRSVKTLIRWILVGVRGVRLQGWKRGNDWYTTAAALEQFKLDCSKAAGAEVVPTPAEVSSAVQRAREQLRRKGFYGRQITSQPKKVTP